MTVTPNPALDVTYQVDALRVGRSHRVHRVIERAGGKGVNVARVVRALDGNAVVVAPFGGVTGSALETSLRADGFDVRPVPVAAQTRRTVTVVADGEATALNEPGRALAPEEWVAVENAVADAAVAGDVAVISGSTPRDAPRDLHARLIERARLAGAATVVDTSGPSLLAAAEAAPALVKPNADELREATGEPDVTTAAHILLDRGARSVVVSLGADGLAGFDGTAAWRVAPVPGLAGNPTGAGDAVVAALALSMSDGTPWPDALVRATACGAAAVPADAAGKIDLGAYARFLPTLTAERFE
ncbi:1-phosphofructokinase family hexose kinase [Haloactinopolyspora alba]|uniref:1-phosphofructokinase family hexose kinase n=1 Tax=Haloactinopolyspora alba TaxID=648780 RepID=UPI00197A991E|nr:hexose kinase [Haloactinopolyspora alba]